MTKKLEPLGFVSRSLKLAEQRLEARYQDFLGLVWTLEQFSWEITGQHVLLITDHSSLKRVLNEINRNQPLPVRVNNAHARLSKFNVDTLHKNDIEDMTVPQNVFSKAIILSRDTEHDEEEDKIDRGFCNAILLHEITPYDEDQRCHKLAKPPE